MARRYVTEDPNYHVEGAPAAAKALITKFATAADEFASIGSQHPADHAAITDDYYRARMNLETWIARMVEKTNQGET